MIDGVLANFAEIDPVLADGAANSRKKHGNTRAVHEFLSTSFFQFFPWVHRQFLSFLFAAVAEGSHEA